MEINITYNNIIERCKMFSDYEARQATDSANENMYSEVVITDGDEALLKDYIEQSFQKIESVLGGALEYDIEMCDDHVVITLGTGKEAAFNGKATTGFSKSLEEASASFCMYKWLLNKLPERSGTYQNMFADMTVVCNKLAWKRVKPKMEE